MVTRIIAGRAGSLQLEVPPSGTRPTSDRVREAIFSALDSWGILIDAQVLDLYAGSGALALEAISRGAGGATLVEKHPRAAQIASRNAANVRAVFGNEDRPTIEVLRQSVQSFLQQCTQHFELIMLDPPYDLGEQELSQNLQLAAPLLTADGVLLVERSRRSPEPIWPAGLSCFREKRYGETTLWWAEPYSEQASD